jgi:hypothetical protein
VKGILFRSGSTCALLLALFAVSASAQIAPEFREEGVLYFEGNLPHPITVTLKAPVTVYLHQDFQMVLAQLYLGQQVDLVGMGPNGFLLMGTSRNNSITGWIRTADLPAGIDPALFEEARKNQERHDAVAVAIANKSVIQGMTPDEVKQSLGRPGQISTRTDATGATLTWVYTTYREEPQYNYSLDVFGRPVLQTYYVKIPIGQVIVDFANGEVSSVEEHRTDPNSPGVVTN